MRKDNLVICCSFALAFVALGLWFTWPTDYSLSLANWGGQIVAWASIAGLARGAGRFDKRLGKFHCFRPGLEMASMVALMTILWFIELGPLSDADLSFGSLIAGGIIGGIGGIYCPYAIAAESARFVLDYAMRRS